MIAKPRAASYVLRGATAAQAETLRSRIEKGMSRSGIEARVTVTPLPGGFEVRASANHASERVFLNAFGGSLRKALDAL